jgi:hypothetical protein
LEPRRFGSDYRGLKQVRRVKARGELLVQTFEFMRYIPIVFGDHLWPNAMQRETTLLPPIMRNS